MARKSIVSTLGIGALGLSLALGCSSSGPEVDDTGGDKSDDFFSEDAYEFVLAVTLPITIEESIEVCVAWTAETPETPPECEETETRVFDTTAKRAKRLDELITLKHIQLAYFFNQFLIEKSKKDPGGKWGGMGGMSKAGSYEEIERTGRGYEWEVTFQQIVAAKVDLMDKIVERSGGSTGYFDLTIGNPTNEELAMMETDGEWFRQKPWKEWDPTLPENASKSMEVDVAIWPEEPTADAWLDYNKMFEDDKLTIDVHMGYDYHKQYHEKHAKAMFKWLTGPGGGEEHWFKAPVSTFADLTHKSGPFTTTLRAPDRASCRGADECKDIDVEVRIIYGKKGSRNTPKTDLGGDQLESDIRTSFKTADVIMFAGHAGPFYGFPLADWKATSHGEITYNELETLEMPSDKYQLVVADGCDTYQIGAALARNQNKPGGKNLNVITTTTYGDATQPYSVQNMLLHLLDTDPNYNHRPRTLRTLLRTLKWANATYMNPLYGIHFVDQNPHVHPYANPDYLGEECTEYRHEQCGAAGNRCGRPGLGDETMCVAACTDHLGCKSLLGSGYVCGQVLANNAIYSRGCYKE